ncbi:MAG: hypothetical protein WAW90_02980 [Minisyncoccia bacterium]
MHQGQHHESPSENHGPEAVLMLDRQIGDDEKKKLWKDLERIREESKDPSRHFAEIDELRRGKLSDFEWHVLANWKNLSEKDINDFYRDSFAERPSIRSFGEEGGRDPRDSFYALMRSLLIDREVEKRKREGGFKQSLDKAA